MAAWRRTALRLAGFTLVAVICADILDAACDPIVLPAAASAGSALSPPTGSSSDACAPTCIPDCFCCSRSETAGQALTLPALTALAQVPSPSPAYLPTVPRPVSELPPLPIS